jgi:hypothetical protein
MSPATTIENGVRPGVRARRESGIRHQGRARLTLPCAPGGARETAAGGTDGGDRLDFAVQSFSPEGPIPPVARLHPTSGAPRARRTEPAPIAAPHPEQE